MQSNLRRPTTALGLVAATLCLTLPALLPLAVATDAACLWGGPDCAWWGWVEIKVTGAQYSVTQIPAPDAAVGYDASCTSTATYAGLLVQSVQVDCVPTVTYGASCVSGPCQPACIDPTVNLQLTGVPVSAYGVAKISSKCQNADGVSGITCETTGAPGVGVCGCSTGPCNPVASSSCTVGTSGQFCVPGTAACSDSGVQVDCKGTDSLFWRKVTHLYCETSVANPQDVVAGTWVATCSGTDP